MTNVVQERPADAKAYIVQALKSIQKVDLSKEDAANKNIYSL